MRAVYTRLREAVQFTRQGRATLRQVFVGGLLVATWWSVLPAAAVAGYLVEVLDTTASGRFEPPTFDDLGGLISTGVPALVVALAYAALPLAGLALVAVRTVRPPAGGVLPRVAVTPLDAALAVGCAVLIAVGVPAAVTAYARERRLGAAFSPDRLVPVLTDVTYLGVALAILVLGVAVLAGTTAAVLLTFGSALLVAPLLLFYSLVLASYVVGTAYGEAVGDVTPAERGPVEFEGYL